MAKSAYAACAGAARLENGEVVEVKYLNAAAIKSLFGKQPPFGPNRKRVGWYWGPSTYWQSVVSSVRGPFTSSTKALKAAVEANRKPEP